jgi:hypothetical protein
MLYLTKNTNTKVAVQANELNTTNEYLWRLFNFETNEEVLAYIVPDEVTERCAIFTLNFDLTDGDTWEYYIYNGISPDLDYISFDLLEVGKMVVNEQAHS